MSRSVSSREVRLQEKDDLDWCESSVQTVSHEMSRGDGEKEARRNIRYLVHVSYIHTYRQRGLAVRLGGLTPARPIMLGSNCNYL